MLSTVVPAITECGPQELLPIMPPSVQRECVAGSGAKVRPCASAALRSASHTTPGSTRASRARASIDSTWSRYFEQSITTATLTAWPLSEVAPPRASTGTSLARAKAQGLDDVLDAARQHDADRHLTVVRGVGGVRGAHASVEAHFACYGETQRSIESLIVDHL